MILRTPPPRKRKTETGDAVFAPEDPISDRRLVIYEDPLPVASHDPTSSSDHMLCTYQCRQMVKSEFLDAFDSAEKKVRDYQSRLEALNDNLCKAETERRKYKDQFHFVEQELAAAKGREQALQEQLLKEVSDSQERHEKLLKRCSELEVQLKKEMDLRRNAESSAAAAKENATLLEEKLRRVSESMEREKNSLRNELVHVQNESKLSVSRMNANLERMGCRANNAEKESELLKTQLEELRKQLNECLYQKTEAERKLSRFTVPSEEASPTKTHILVKHLQEDLRNYEAEVREARKLKSSHVNSELLKEKLLEEQSRRERAEKELFELQVVQLNVKKLEDELMSWKSMLKEIPDVSCSDDIPRKFASLQKELIDSMMKLGEISAHLKQLEVALESADLAKQHAETEAALAKEKAEESLLVVKRLELMLSSAIEERERLRKDAIAWKKQKSGEAEGGKAHDSLVKELESSLSERQCTVRELERNLHEQRQVITGQHDELKLLNEKLNNEARRIKSLEREGDRLRSEISLLESKLGHGDYSAANTKVLRMVNTLAVDNEGKHTIEALQAELQKTKAKLQAVEDLKGQSEAGTIVDSHIPEKLAQLKAQIATLEKREERYKTVFAEKISVFRRACCSLFGYKVEIFIRKMNSIPAFTANLTVESFNRRTLS
ncbi:mitotic spindle checkpoint protein MAD1 isoform X2 [Magnolia sinica]|uniref:mitotic spindle checkpoint protein MAD1 isoform X2 n=1 Tax=Magnolia sinica TaxID=86752 RepID=UPI00265B1A0F|nr:mitotic spindle checkpoint protein MAD1 isoform X2 [Magnolia sinica]